MKTLNTPLCLAVLCIGVFLSSCGKVDNGNPGSGGTPEPPEVFEAEDYTGSFTVSHDCNIDLTVTTVDLVNSTTDVIVNGSTGINFQALIKGLTSNSNLIAGVDDRDLSVNAQSVDIANIGFTTVTADISGDGGISDDKATITLNLAYDVAGFVDGTCTCTLERD